MEKNNSILIWLFILNVFCFNVNAQDSSQLEDFIFVECHTENNISILFLKPANEVHSLSFKIGYNSQLCEFKHSRKNFGIENSNHDVNYKLVKKKILVNITFDNIPKILIDTLRLVSGRDTVQYIFDYRLCLNFQDLDSIPTANDASVKLEENKSEERTYYYSPKTPNKLFYLDYGSNVLSYYSRIRNE